MNALRILPLVAVSFLVACGGRSAELAGDSPAPSAGATSAPPSTPAPTSSTPSVPPVVPPVVGCGGLDAVVYERGARTLSSLDGSTGAPSKLGAVDCAGMQVEALTVERSGDIVVLSRQGEVARVDGKAPHACTMLPALPAPAAAYRGALAIPGSGDILTLRLGTAAQYLADGSYHHELVRITPDTGSTTVVARLDDTMYPDALQPARDGRVLLVYFGAEQVRVWEPWKSGTVLRTSVVDLGQGRAAAVVPGGDLRVLGDVHYAGPSSGPDALPSYLVNPSSGALVRSADVVLPGRGIFEIAMGSTACTFDR